MGHLFEQGLDIVGVALGVAKLRGIKRGVHAGQPAKSIHAQTGIIRQRRQAAQGRRMARFGQGIFDKGMKRLVSLRKAERGSMTLTA